MLQFQYSYRIKPHVQHVSFFSTKPAQLAPTFLQEQGQGGRDGLAALAGRRQLGVGQPAAQGITHALLKLQEFSAHACSAVQAQQPAAQRAKRPAQRAEHRSLARRMLHEVPTSCAGAAETIAEAAETNAAGAPILPPPPTSTAATHLSVMPRTVLARLIPASRTVSLMSSTTLYRAQSILMSLGGSAQGTFMSLGS